MHLACKKKKKGSSIIARGSLAQQQGSVINVCSVFAFSFCWGIVLYRSNRIERSTNSLPAWQFRSQQGFLCGYGLVWLTHPCLSVKRFLSVVASSPPLIEGNLWVIVTLCIPLEGKCVTFGFQHNNQTPTYPFLHHSWTVFWQSPITCPWDSGQAQDFSCTATRQLPPEASASF